MTSAYVLVFVSGLAVGLAAGGLWRAWRSRSERSVEDALKHLYECEYRRHAASLESLGGALDLSSGQAARLVARLESRGLVRSDAAGPLLTDEGRAHALRLIRSHRLWEQYLAERTGYAESLWHREADLREHRITAGEAESLSAVMGHPRYDPHGDPIPTADGEVPPPRGGPLTSLAAGDAGTIVHVEDEPPEVYAQLLSEGLSRGMQFRVISKEAESITINVDGRRHVLPPVVAANLSVEAIRLPDDSQFPSRRLSDLALGQRAIVLGILPACRGPARRRLLDLGLLPGTVVEAELRSAGGEPTAYRIRGAVIALRRDQTDLVRVRPSNSIPTSSP
jgi:DtxR family Mn-dependent transcriptional regulator